MRVAYETLYLAVIIILVAIFGAMGGELGQWLAAGHEAPPIGTYLDVAPPGSVRHSGGEIVVSCIGLLRLFSEGALPP